MHYDPTNHMSGVHPRARVSSFNVYIFIGTIISPESSGKNFMIKFKNTKVIASSTKLVGAKMANF